MLMRSRYMKLAGNQSWTLTLTLVWLSLRATYPTHSQATDLGEKDKPWRLPGADQTDFFNYGFDEFTWAAYCLKQKTLRDEAKEQKKQIEEMQNMFGGSGGASANPAAAMMPNMGEMTPDMQQAMQAMMTSGVDPSQMDFSMFMSMMNPGAQGMGAQAFGQQAQSQQQLMSGFGYGHEGGGGGSGGGGGGGGGGDGGGGEGGDGGGEWKRR